MDKQAATKILLRKLEEWEAQPKSSGYEYEQHFISVMEGLNQELFQLSLGELPKDRNKKKSKHNLGS